MTLGELYDQIGEYLERHPRDGRDMKVVVRLNNFSMGPVATTEINNMHGGFDWDRGSFFLGTDKPVYHARPVTREQMKESCQSILGSIDRLGYLPKQRKHAWEDGYKHGFDVGVQSRFAETHPPEPNEVIEKEI